MIKTENKRNLAWVSLGALGVVYGDIGTSPLYAVRECFNGPHGVEPTPENVLGILSLILWSLISIISVKYMAVVMRADNRGEGGILALMAIAAYKDGRRPEKERNFLIALGLFGAALLYGDGMITPAISVLGAVEGLETVTPRLHFYIVPITIAILIGLFLVQRHGTARIGNIFGPVILLWFIAISALGIRGIFMEPKVLMAVNPLNAAYFFMHHGFGSIFVFGAVFLCVTGGEALYADMGHFGRTPIRLGWFTVALPGLALNYMGQGALIISDPTMTVNPFYALVPRVLLYPMIVLATASAVIASQAVITGAFSLTRQAVLLGFLPRLRILHTSSREIGQIFVPTINVFLAVATIGLVLGFRNSNNLGGAYGVAVTTTMLITTIIVTFVMNEVWHWPKWRILLTSGTFLFIDLWFWGSTLLKIPHGGWFAILVGVFVYVLMSTWRAGRSALYERLRRRTLSLEQFIQSVTLNGHKAKRVDGAAIFMSGSPTLTPVVLLHNLKYNKILHKKTVVLSIVIAETAHVNKSERVKLDDLGHGFYRIVANYGFMESPQVREIIDLCHAQGLELEYRTTGFYVGRESIVITKSHGIKGSRMRLFAAMSRLAQGVTTFFGVPPNQVVELGVQIEL